MIPLPEARAVLGPAAHGLADEDIARLVEFADAVAGWAIEAEERATDRASAVRSRGEAGAA